MKSLDVPFDHSVTGCAIRILFTLWQIADSFPSQDFPNVSSSPLQLTINISESRLPEKEVANLTNLLLMHGMRLKAATQNDSQQAAKLNFELLDISTNLLSSLGSQQRANFIGVVHLDPVYGIIRFTAPIDRERLCPEFQGTNQPCNINLIVVAHQMFHQIQQATKHPPKIGPLIGMVYIDLTVTVLDINDNAPYFPKLSTADGGVRVILISEECKLGTLISLPMASDADSIEHGVRSYLFHPLSTPLEVLEHFQIVLIPGLGTQCEHLDPRVLDHATIMDDQDTHSGTLKKTVEQITPCLQVIQRIDRERIDRFSFRLIALDSDDNRGEVVIRLIVRDINDHAPTWLKTLTVFDSSGKSSLVEAVHLADSQHVTMDNRTADRTRYEFGVKECTAQRKLVQLKAVDLDDPETENGKVTYQIIEQSADIEKIRRRFFISREYVYITELGLRGLRHGNLSLLIVASDGAGAVSEAEIVLHIEDCNDHRPMILIRNSEFIVPEDTYDKPHLIGLVTVRDLDLTTSPNSIFRCSLNDSRYLALKEVVTGPTELVASVLTEQIGANRRHLASPTIPDSFSPGTEWKHQGRWSVYRLETQTDAHFDREEKAFYSASLQCADNGVPSLSSTRLITIHISDVNDNPPEFYQEDDEKNTHLPTYHINQIDPFWPIPTSNPVAITHSVEKQSLFEFSILENAERGSFIGRLHARDRDIGENARLTFEIIPANETLVVAMAKWPTSAYGSDSFTVSVTGELHLIKQLDREEQSKYLVLVRVRDHGTPKSLSATATVVVNVADVNDCPPEFHGEYIFEVSRKNKNVI
ncbi:protocadherin delta 1 [Paragonimus westermani]|uniref:Protocadherin delta 1 n=1 Tax=Paragonimus westermani TaxID=34504 RepID=A0A5J4NUZ0_9TREM|nr:protocadherin delta 1 [Paragonimus westermani]